MDQRPGWQGGRQAGGSLQLHMIVEKIETVGFHSSGLRHGRSCRAAFCELNGSNHDSIGSTGPLGIDTRH